MCNVRLNTVASITQDSQDSQNKKSIHFPPDQIMIPVLKNRMFTNHRGTRKQKFQICVQISVQQQIYQ